MLKESARERINAVYSAKEQCRKEFQDEITRLRNQFQLVSSQKKKNELSLFSYTHRSMNVIITLIKYFYPNYEKSLLRCIDDI